MAKKEVHEIVSKLRNYDYEDIAIALMVIENKDGELQLSNLEYDKYKEVYDYYFRKRDDLTGMLNEVLQNPDEVYEEIIESHKRL